MGVLGQKSERAEIFSGRIALTSERPGVKRA